MFGALLVAKIDRSPQVVPIQVQSYQECSEFPTVQGSLKQSNYFFISIQVYLHPLCELRLHILLTTFLGIETLRKQRHPNSRAGKY